MRISDWSSDVCSSDLAIDGSDPAAFAWAIVEAEQRLERFITDPARRYPAPIPYVIAETVKGYGFPGAGTNAAHNLPLAGNPALDEAARRTFNEAAADRKSTRLNSSH